MLFSGFQTQRSEYCQLKSQRLLQTLKVLQQRIDERFPGSGLSQVTKELQGVGDNCVKLTDKLSEPIWVVRLVTIAAIITLIVITVWLVTLSFQMIPAREKNLISLLQGAESAINELIFLSLTVLFFATLESRLKRRMALKSLHRLRSIAHVVDMHQLTKDPIFLLSGYKPTAAVASGRTMTAYELSRYLDYCSELLSIISKLAALHVQNFQDSQVMTTVNDIENLTQGLVGKIWQKIMILDMTAPGAISGAVSSLSNDASTR